MHAIGQTKTFTHQCSPDECCDIMKEANNTFTLFTDAEELKRRANLFQALGNEVRLRILGLLAIQEMCTCNIVEALESPASTITFHLRKLETGGLISSHRVGKFTIYRLNNDLIKHHRVFEEALDSQA